MNLKILEDKSARWWRKQKVDWAIQDKKGAWWIIPGSEFPEKKIDKNMKIKTNHGEKDNGTDLKFLFFVMLASFLGVSLAVALSYFISK